METINKIVVFLDDLLWAAKIGPFSILALLLVGTGIWFTIKTGFIQIRGFKKGADAVFGGLFKKSTKADHRGMSPFQALATAVAAQVGTGNIVGASTAIAVGGPGAIFWMWIAAFFGMATIFVGAFNGQALAGGAIGWTIKNALSKGVARGLFSNEAGMGSTPHAHAVAKVDKPADQGYVAMMGVFIDTFIILNLTAFVVIGTKVCYDNPRLGIAAGELTGAALAQAGFATVYKSFGNVFVAIALLFFAFSTIIGWYFFGAANWKYLFGVKTMKLYAAIVSICIFLGAFVLYVGVDVETVWTAQDMLNGFMVIPNLLAILALTKVALKCMKEK